MSFFKRFFGVKAEQSAGYMVNILANWDPRGATEAERQMIADKLSQFCVKCEEARRKLEKEDKDVAVINEQYNKKLQLAKKWNAEIENPETDAARRSQLQSKLPGLVQELKGFGPKIDKEVAEAEMARKVFETYDQIVRSTNEKLQKKIAQTGQLESELELANVKKELAKQQVDAAKVLSGLKAEIDSFDVASGAIRKQADKANTEAEAMLREAGLLMSASGAKNDDFMDAELANIEGGGGETKSFAEQLAELEAKM